MADIQELMDIPEEESEYLNIDWNSREITIPSIITNIGVYNDKDTNRIYFRCPVDYGDCKVADFGLHVNYVNTGDSGQEYDGDVYLIDDAKVDGEYMTFSWLVGRHAYLEQGTTAFIVCCKIVDNEGIVVNELNTTVTRLPVLEGLEIETTEWEDEYPDLLEEILKKVDEALYATQNAITGINVNGDPAPVENHVAEISAATTEDLESVKETANDAKTAAEDAKSSIPTKVSELENDSGYITDDALGEYATQDDLAEVRSVADTAESIANDANDAVSEVKDTAKDALANAEQAQILATNATTTASTALERVQTVEETAITAITLNGDSVPVSNNLAAIEFDDVSNGSDGIKALTVDGDLFDYVNEICDTIGVYFMRATSDTPNIPETAAFFIMLLRNSNAQATMIAFRAGSNTNTYMCKEQASSWGDWTQVIPSGGSEPTVDGETLIF